VVSPHINTLVYPLLVHVVRRMDFRRSMPRTADGSDGRGGETSIPLHAGAQDVLPSASGGGAARAIWVEAEVGPTAGH
jgi:hypothetical protein